MSGKVIEVDGGMAALPGTAIEAKILAEEPKRQRHLVKEEKQELLMGKYVLTGGATGIGAAIKQQLLDQDHVIVVVDLKDGDYLADLGDPAARKTVIDQVKADHPEIDGLITCAGVASQFPNPAKILQINYFGTVEIIEGLSETIASGGRVVAISSNSAPMSTRPT